MPFSHTMSLLFCFSLSRNLGWRQADLVSERHVDESLAGRRLGYRHALLAGQLGQDPAEDYSIQSKGGQPISESLQSVHERHGRANRQQQRYGGEPCRCGGTDQISISDAGTCCTSDPGTDDTDGGEEDQYESIYRFESIPGPRTQSLRERFEPDSDPDSCDAYSEDTSYRGSTCDCCHRGQNRQCTTYCHSQWH